MCVKHERYAQYIDSHLAATDKQTSNKNIVLEWAAVEDKEIWCPSVCKDILHLALRRKKLDFTRKNRRFKLTKDTQEVRCKAGDVRSGHGSTGDNVLHHVSTVFVALTLEQLTQAFEPPIHVELMSRPGAKPSTRIP